MSERDNETKKRAQRELKHSYEAMKRKKLKMETAQNDQYEVKLQYDVEIKETFKEQIKEVKHSMKALLQAKTKAEQESAEKKLRGALAFFKLGDQKKDTNKEEAIDALREFLNTPLKIREPDGVIQEQYPFIFFADRFKHKPKLLATIENFSKPDIYAKGEENGAAQLVQAMEQRDIGLVKTLLTHFPLANVFKNEEGETPYQLAKKDLKDPISKLVIHASHDEFSRYLNPYIKNNDFIGPYETRRKRKASSTRLHAMQFLSEVQKVLVEDPNLNPIKKTQVYLGALHYLESLLLAEHKGGRIHSRWTNDKSDLEILIEKRDKRHTEFIETETGRQASLAFWL